MATRKIKEIILLPKKLLQVFTNILYLNKHRLSLHSRRSKQCDFRIKL